MGTFDAGKGATRNSYDSEVPPNLLEFMLRSWRPKSARAPKALRDAASFRARRERLSRRFPGELLVIPTGHRKVRVERHVLQLSSWHRLLLPHRARSSPTACCCWCRRATGHEPLLYVEPNPGKSDATFFTDRNKGELWEGPRLGVAESASLYALPCRPLRGARRRACHGAAGVAWAGPRAARAFRRQRGTGCAPMRPGRRSATRNSRPFLVGDAAAQGCQRGARAAQRHGRHQARLRGRDRAPQDRAQRTRARGRVLDARPYGGERCRLHLDRGLRRARLHAALEAQRRRDPQGRPAAARRRHRGPLALHGRHHAHAADFWPLLARTARGLRHRAGRAARGARARASPATTSWSRTGPRWPCSPMGSSGSAS